MRGVAITGRCLAALAVAGCEPWVLDPHGQVGRADRTILVDSVAIMLAIVVPTILAIFAFAWWYRASNTHARYLPEWSYSGRLELLVWSVPLLTIMLLGGVSWIGAHQLDPSQKLVSDRKSLEIQGVSLDWKWLFIYPDQGIASVNQLVIPVGTDIHFSLTSGSVMNVFFIPQLGSMIYTMNGMQSQLHLDADAPGDFRGQASHFNGDGFSDMHFDVNAVPPAQFAAWVAAARGHGPTLNAGTYAALARQSRNVAPFTYGAADRTLFAAVVAQKLPPGPGPTQGRPNPSVSPRTAP
jgi:cytochrome o ubiquinol oxidase subunit 2